MTFFSDAHRIRLSVGGFSIPYLWADFLVLRNNILFTGYFALNISPFPKWDQTKNYGSKKRVPSISCKCYFAWKLYPVDLSGSLVNNWWELRRINIVSFFPPGKAYKNFAPTYVYLHACVLRGGGYGHSLHSRSEEYRGCGGCWPVRLHSEMNWKKPSLCSLGVLVLKTDSAQR